MCDEKNKSASKSKFKTMGEFDYDKKRTFEQRCKEAKEIIEKYSDKVPVLVQKSSNSKLPGISHCKFLVPSNITVGQFLAVIRKKISGLSSSQSLWFFVNNTLPPTSSTMGTLYNEHKSDDGFLRMAYCEENMFG